MNPEQIKALQAGFANVSDKLGDLCEKESSLSDGMRTLAGNTDELITQMRELRALLQQIQIEPSAPEVMPPPEVAPILEQTPPEPVQESIPEPVEEITPEAAVVEEAPHQITQPEAPEAASIETEPVPEKSTSFSRALDAYEQERTPGKKRLLTDEEGNFEFQLGVKWLSRIGIIALLIGLAMALSYSFPNFTKEMKILTGFILAGGMYGIGHWLFNQSPVLGRILQGGGISLGYLSLFAIFFIPEVQLMDTPEFGLVLLLAYVAGILTLAHRLNSQTVALLSLAFGYYTASYSESHVIAFLSAAILSLATVGVTRLHRDWNVIAKANLLGAFWTYLMWHNEVPIGEISGKLYLAYTFILFHVVSLLRSDRGETLLNALNIAGFFVLFRTTQPDPQPEGSLELILAGIQLGSLLTVNSLRPDQKQTPLPHCLLITSLIFVVLGVMHFFDTQSTSAVLTALALGIGLLSKKSSYQKILAVSTYFLLLFSVGSLIFVWARLADNVLLANVAWLCACALLLEAFAFQAHDLALRMMLIYMPLVLLWLTILDAAPAHWRTASFMLTGFFLLAIGFIQPRKLYRWTGLAWIFLVGGFSMLPDLISLSTGYKIILFILLGVGLLAGSYGYSLLERKLKK